MCIGCKAAYLPRARTTQRLAALPLRPVVFVACAALNDACAKATVEVDGHTIGVRVYAPHDDSPSLKTLYVSNLAPDVAEAELTELFASCGGMKEARHRALCVNNRLRPRCICLAQRHLRCISRAGPVGL